MIACLQFLVITLIYLGLSSFYYPIVFAVVLLYLSQPSIRFLCKRIKLSKPFAIGFIFVIQMFVIVLLLSFAIPYLVREVTNFISQLPQLLDHIFNETQTALVKLGLDYLINLDLLKNEMINLTQEYSNVSLHTLVQTIRFAKGNASQILSPVIWLINIFMVPVMYFFLGLYAENIIPWVKKTSPDIYQHFLVFGLELGNSILSDYFRGQIIVISILACLYATALYLFGLPSGFLIGFTTGIMSFIPYFGVLIGFSLAAISLVYVTSSLTYFIGLILIYAGINALESLYLTPSIMGNRVGLSNLAGLISMIVGANLFGLSGLVFAIPATAFCKELFQSLVGYSHSMTPLSPPVDDDQPTPAQL